MKTVYKYRTEGQVEMPLDAKLLHFDIQGHVLWVWAEVDPTKPKGLRILAIVGTGCPVSEGLKYVATAQQGAFVWHLYDGGYEE